MKKAWPFIVLLNMIANISFAQQPQSGSKGASPIEETATKSNPTKTWAVIVGISNYQDQAIPDLRYAHKDAEAFATFLKTEAGGKLTNDQIKLLTEKEATRGNFVMALYWLIENVKEGEQAIIYFSGHGDVELKDEDQPGYLLCWDSPSKLYMTGGALDLRDLQGKIKTLTNKIKAKVIVITDACHSGALAGSTVGGAQATTAALATQFSNEVKILSCQPDEYSIEGEQWGGGRGAFSFNLVNALYGLADKDKNLLVTLKEVEGYLQDHVTTEVAPVSQNPKVVGNIKTTIALVDTVILDSLKSGKTSQMAMLSPAQPKGFEDDLLDTLEASERADYIFYKKALQQHMFFEPEKECVEYYFNRLIKNQKLNRLHNTMRRNYAAALIDDSQQVLNKWLKASPDQTSGNAPKGKKLPKKVFTQKLMTFPKYIDKAIDLLGEDNYMYNELMSRKYFFEAYLLANSNQNPDNELGKKALELLKKCLQYVPKQPHVYWQMSRVFGWNLNNADSMEIMAQNAIQLYPSWVVPYTDLSFMFSYKFNNPDKAKKYIEKAIEMDSSSVAAWNNWGLYSYKKKDFVEAERKFTKATQLDPNNANAWNNLGNALLASGKYELADKPLLNAVMLDSTNFGAISNLGSVYLQTFKYTEAEKMLKKSIQIDSSIWQTYTNLAIVLQRLQKWEESEIAIQKAIKKGPSVGLLFAILGNAYAHIPRYVKKAEPNFAKAIELQPYYPDTYVYKSQLAFKTGNVEKGWEFLEQALKIGVENGELKYQGLINDKDLQHKHKEQKWKDLMKKYFPPAPLGDKVKD